MPASPLKKHRREQIRAAVLMILEVARPVWTSERLVHSTLGEAFDYVGPGELRRALTYLEDKGLVEIERLSRKLWKARQTPKGVDVVQHAQQRPPGIGPVDEDMFT